MCWSWKSYAISQIQSNLGQDMSSIHAVAAMDWNPPHVHCPVLMRHQCPTEVDAVHGNVQTVQGYPVYLRPVAGRMGESTWMIIGSSDWLVTMVSNA